jgi:hypothetical protein
MKNEMTLEEIKTLTKAGKPVYWVNKGYVVSYTKFPSGKEQWLVVCEANDSAVGLADAEGNLIGKGEGFFTPEPDEVILGEIEMRVTSQSWQYGDYSGDVVFHESGETNIDWDEDADPETYAEIEELIYDKIHN